MRLTDVGFVLLLVLPFLVALDDSTIWDANEAFYVETPREMMERGEWIVPYFNGEPRLNKPPLSYWIVTVFYKAMGVSVLAERIATALVAITAVAFVFLIGRHLYSLPVALLGTGIFATTFRFLILSRRLIIDILLLCCLLGAFLAFLYWIKTERPHWLRWCALALGLAFLAKGPVTVLAPIAMALYLSRERLWEAFFRSSWKSSTFIFLAVSSSWFLLLLYHEGWEPVSQFFWRENVGRYTGVDFGPQRGFLYYPGVFLADFFPWSSLFLLVAARQLYTSRRKQGRITSSTALLWIWMLVFFIFFSLSQNKQEYYILPVYPAAALWLAAKVEQEKLTLWIRFFPALSIILAGGILWFISRGLFPDYGRLWIPLLFMAAAAIFLFQGRLRATTAGMALFYTAGFLLYLSPLEEYKPVKPLAQAIQSEMAHVNSQLAWTVGYYRFTAPSLRFYLNQDIVQLFHPEELQEVWAREGPVLLLIERSDYEMLQEQLPAPPGIVECKRKLYTTTRSFLKGFFTRGVDDFRSEWTREIYLVANYRSAESSASDLSGCSGL